MTTAFASEFAKGMESLMRELAENSGLDLDARDDVGRDPAISAAWEAMLAEEMDKMPGTAPASTSTSQQKRSTPPPSTSKAGPNKQPAPTSDEFQSRIRDTMDKLKSSESDCNPSTAPLPTFPGPDDPSLAALLQGLETMDPKEGDELTGMLEAMMGQLMSREVLYEPLKELDEKFPAYLASHPALSVEDKERYEKQRTCIKRLLTIFEEKGYNEEDAKTREKITEAMGELQSYGSPPEEIMGPLPPGMAMGTDGLPELPEGCVVF
ncbi:Pex19 protein [Pisolithus croceorrhizus]|nr:Pex19 protein [Pisolithus croceorrhizus]